MRCEMRDPKRMHIQHNGKSVANRVGVEATALIDEVAEVK
jgi:hypothetical protein